MMTRRSYRALVVIGAVAAVILTALLAVTPRPPLVEVIEGPPVTVSVGPPPAGPTPTELSELPADPLPEVEPIPIPDWLPLLIRLVVIAVVVGLLIHLARRVIQARRATRRRTAEAPGGDAVEVAEIDEDELADTVEATVAQLRRGIAVESAVVECWLRLERLAADSGITRRPAQTSEEFTVDVLSRTRVDETAIASLGSLYRQALFSTHALTDADRDRAIDCLELLRGQLKVAR